MNSTVLEEDLAKLANLFDGLDIANKRFFITGVTGLIGSLLVKTLIRLAEKKQDKVYIVGLARDPQKVAATYSDYVGEVEFVYGDICSEEIFHEISAIDLIIHAACPTDSKYFTSNPVETIHSIYQGTKNVLELARRCHVSSMVYISSMEVYGIVDSDRQERISEETLGKLDILNIRSSYSEGKRLAECLCKSYQEEYGVPVRIARLAQTFGPGVANNDNRVYMQFARSVIAGENIILQTVGDSYGNYCYSRDTIAAILRILLNGEIGEAYNVVNESSTMQIKEMAQLVSENIAQGKISVEFAVSEESKRKYAPSTALKLSSRKLEGLGWHPEVGLTESYQFLIAYMEGD